MYCYSDIVIKKFNMQSKLPYIMVFDISTSHSFPRDIKGRQEANTYVFMNIMLLSFLNNTNIFPRLIYMY